jgi:periplasmic protein TonB
MFEDFADSSHRQQTNKRLRRSLAIALAVYGGAGVALVSASSTARQIVKEHLTQVQFAPPPEAKPEPPPPPPPPVESVKPKSARAGVSKRAALKPPDHMPTDKPAESDAPLMDPGPTGPQDGVLGEVGGTGKDAVTSAPPPAPAPAPKLVAAKELPGNQQPPYPKRAQRDEIEGDVLVAFDVLEDGRVANPQIVKGPADFHEVVLQIALSWRFQPAMLGGKPVKSRRTKLVSFRLKD